MCGCGKRDTLHLVKLCQDIHLWLWVMMQNDDSEEVIQRHRLLLKMDMFFVFFSK